MSLAPSDFGFSAAKFPAFRRTQLDTAISLHTTPHRFVALDAATGAGKSLIYMTLGAMGGGRVLVLTAKKGLQDQLMTDFGPSGMVDLRGAENYKCVEFGNCGVPSQLDIECGKVGCGQCPRTQAVARARQAKYVVTNYHTWLSYMKYGDPTSLGSFDVLVCDEGHLAPGILSEFCGFKISREEVRELLGAEGVEGMPDGDNGVEDWWDWSKKAVEVGRSRYRELDESQTEKRVRLTRLGKGLAEFVKTPSSSFDHWTVEAVSPPSAPLDSLEVVIAPIPWPYQFAESLLFNKIPKVVLSSAFLPRSIWKRLGIKEEEFRRFEVPSTFKSEARPFYYIPTLRVDHGLKKNEAGLNKLVKRIDEVIQTRQNMKGIIQCRSYDWGREVVKRSRFGELMLSHRPGETMQVLEKFKRSDKREHRILVSPAIEEGFDFPGDQCRWQVILKVPFINAKTRITKARSRFDSGYVNEEAALSLLQQVGRSTRGEEDWSECFIFDDHWVHFSARTYFPLWFRRSWRKAERVPLPKKGGEERAVVGF